MTARFQFFQKILTNIEEMQKALNTLRATIKKEIQNEESRHAK